jgi:YHS domain-containing protein
MKKFWLCITAILISWTFSLLVGATQITPINIDTEGVALKGYDPVAYFTMGRPVKGLEKFQHVWQGATWLFISHDHLNLFQKNPEKYAPQYGGY